VNFNKNINKKSDFGTVRFEFGTVDYEFYESPRESLYFYSMFGNSIYRFYMLKSIFDNKLEKIFEKNVKLFLRFFTKISIITSHR
jgi:hypothetical protein